MPRLLSDESMKILTNLLNSNNALLDKDGVLQLIYTAQAYKAQVKALQSMIFTIARDVHHMTPEHIDAVYCTEALSLTPQQALEEKNAPN